MDGQIPLDITTTLPPLLVAPPSDSSGNVGVEVMDRQGAAGIVVSGTFFGLKDIENISLNDDARKKIHNLLTLVNQRLSVMPEMAQLKLELGQKVLDAAREKDVMRSALTYAENIGLYKELAMRFVQAQMDAAKLLQSRVCEHANMEKIRAEERKKVLRERIINITPAMLDALKVIQDDLHMKPFKAAVFATLKYQVKEEEPLKDNAIQEMILKALYPDDPQ